MVEEQVDVLVLVADIEAMLPADEGEALAELDQEFLQMTDERGLEFALMEWLGEGEEVMALVEGRQLAGTGIGWTDAHLMAAALIARVDLWTLDRALADAWKRIGAR